jgi:hypothetical protein
MRYLRRQILNPKSPSDSAVAVSISGEVILDRPYSLQLPKGVSADRSSDTTSPTYVNGMIRYNTETKEFEGYQGGTTTGSGQWRSFKFKEPGNIILDDLGTGDAVENTFKLSVDPFTYLTHESAIDVINGGLGWDEDQMAKNLIVIVGQVYQVGTINFDVVQNPTIGPNAPYTAGTYLVFGTPPPMGQKIFAFHNFDR